MLEEKRYTCKGKKELFEINKCVECEHFSFCLNGKAENENATLCLYEALKTAKGEL